VHVTFNDGETADLEMQTDKYADDLKKRAEFYASALLVGQHKRGKLYRSAKQVYQIFFLNCVLFPQSDKFSRRYFFQEEEEHDRLSDGTEIIFYELPKLETRLKDCLAGGAGTENLPEDEKWCIYMKYRHEQGVEELIEELCQKEEGIMRAENEVRKISREYKQYARNFAEMKNSIDRQFDIERGFKEGRQQGIAENTLEIARKMKELGEPLEKIQTITGLPVATIEQIQMSK
jgi:predicted transposase/invertase (TIGR01784 family)